MRSFILPEQKILSLPQAETIIHSLKAHGKTIVFTNGCFDILHRGHVDYLMKAAALGDVFVLGLNSDESVRLIKGEKRPLNAEQDRAMILASLACVDYVVLFSESTPEILIRKFMPHFLVKGGDYISGSVVGQSIVEAAGGEVVILPFLQGYSSYTIIKSICNRYENK